MCGKKSTHHEVIEKVVSYAVSIGFKVLNIDFSPIKLEGNIEYLLHIQKTDNSGTFEDVDVDLKSVVDNAFDTLAK